jgi:hypothetical protein
MKKSPLHTLLIEVTDRETRFETVREITGQHPALPLLLPVYGADTPKGLKREKLASGKVSLAETDVIIGFEEDPCHPFAPRFERTMRLLEQLAQASPRSVTINTRSPLLVLALPVLKSFEERLTVNVALETHDDEFAQRYLPELPRPSERIKLIRALKTFEINVTIQVSPVVPQNRERKKSFELALQLRKLSCPMRIVDYRDISRPGGSAESLRVAADAPVSGSSVTQIQKIISELSPELLLDSAAEQVAA